MNSKRWIHEELEILQTDLPGNISTKEKARRLYPLLGGTRTIGAIETKLLRLGNPGRLKKEDMTAFMEDASMPPNYEAIPPPLEEESSPLEKRLEHCEQELELIKQTYNVSRTVTQRAIQAALVEFANSEPMRYAVISALKHVLNAGELGTK